VLDLNVRLDRPTSDGDVEYSARDRELGHRAQASAGVLGRLLPIVLLPPMLNRLGLGKVNTVSIARKMRCEVPAAW
jgi:hypothetical protein